jgi:hypothetical protein
MTGDPNAKTEAAAAEATASTEPIVVLDGRQSQRAAEIARGTQRVLGRHGLAAIPEVELASGRRADLLAVAGNGDIWIVEVKSSVEDLRADHKWPEYRAFADRVLFAVAPDFPVALIAEDAGLIVADRYGGEILRVGVEHRLAGARRKAVMLRFARIAAGRLLAIADPEQRLEAVRRD